ncbi:LuxR C-terminal-related transcriptional regulator [Kiritimatiellota bacterium B12222]|nr:LuxR C-terminal-related transcriptional regulator [Kiritimatiellota bacterium B12222]
MNTLMNSQWKDLQAYAHLLHENYSLEHFHYCCVEELPRLLGVNWVGVSVHNAQLEITSLQVTAPYLSHVYSYQESLLHTASSHPVLSGLGYEEQLERLQSINKMSDFVSEQEFIQTEIYQEAYRHLEIKDQLLTSLKIAPEENTIFALNSDRVIQQEQRMLAHFVKSHLVVAYRNVRLFSQRKSSFLENDPLRELQETLSPRLQDVLSYLLKGFSRKMIADKLNLSIHTINDYLKEIYAKFNIHSHAELMAMFTTEPHFPPKK